MNDRDYLTRLVLRGLAERRFTLADPDVRAVLRGERAHEIRRRVLPVRLRSEPRSPTIEGIAAAYGVEYQIGGGKRERIEAGAFTESIRSRPSVALMAEHSWDLGPVGVAVLSDSSTGLRFRAEPWLDTDRGRAFYRAAQSGALNGVSIGFVADEVVPECGGKLDVVKRGSVVEVSLCLMQANPGAVVESVA